MKYAIIGAGGTGGVLAAYMTKAGKDVTIIARGETLKAINENGLILKTTAQNITETIPVKVVSAENCQEKMDVVIVCVKGYSVDNIIPVIEKIAHKNTIVIPILNIFTTGSRIQKSLPDLLVTDGCIYVVSNIEKPGVILNHSKILKVVFGLREDNRALYETRKAELNQIENDLKESHIDAILSQNILKEALKKFSYVSPAGITGLYLNVTAGEIQKEGEARELFKGLIREVEKLANAMGIEYEEDLVNINLQILDTLPKETTTSMQRDVMENKESEIDGLLHEIVRMAKQYDISVPLYENASNKFM